MDSQASFVGNRHMSYSLLGVKSNMGRKMKKAIEFPKTERETAMQVQKDVLQFSYGNGNNQSIFGHS